MAALKIGLAAPAAFSAARLRLPLKSLVTPAWSAYFMSPPRFLPAPGSPMRIASSAENAPGLESLSRAVSEALTRTPLTGSMDICAWIGTDANATMIDRVNADRNDMVAPERAGPSG